MLLDECKFVNYKGSLFDAKETQIQIHRSIFDENGSVCTAPASPSSGQGSNPDLKHWAK